MLLNESIEKILFLLTVKNKYIIIPTVTFVKLFLRGSFCLKSIRYLMFILHVLSVLESTKSIVTSLYFNSQSKGEI